MPIEDVCMNESREALKQEFRDEEYRYAYAEDFLNTWVATQIVALREQRGLNQAELGALDGRGFGQPPGPGKRHADHTSVGQVGDDLVLGHTDLLDARITIDASHSVHTTLLE